MLNIYVTRYGQDQDNIKGILNGQRDEELTDEGVKQAETLASKIKAKGLKFDKIYCSPLKRAHNTARTIAIMTDNPEPEVMESLIERDFGVMTGKMHSDIIPMCSPRLIKSKDIVYFLDPEGAETFPDLINRGEKTLRKIQDTHKDGNILLVTHGDTGKMIYTAFYDLPWERVLQDFYFGNGDMLLLSKDSPASKPHIFKVSEGQTKAQQIN